MQTHHQKPATNAVASVAEPNPEEKPPIKDEPLAKEIPLVDFFEQGGKDNSLSVSGESAKEKTDRLILESGTIVNSKIDSLDSIAAKLCDPKQVKEIEGKTFELSQVFTKQQLESIAEAQREIALVQMPDGRWFVTIGEESAFGAIARSAGQKMNEVQIPLKGPIRIHTHLVTGPIPSSVDIKNVLNANEVSDYIVSPGIGVTKYSVADSAAARVDDREWKKALSTTGDLIKRRAERLFKEAEQNGKAISLAEGWKQAIDFYSKTNRDNTGYNFEELGIKVEFLPWDNISTAKDAPLTIKNLDAIKTYRELIVEGKYEEAENFLKENKINLSAGFKRNLFQDVLTQHANNSFTSLSGYNDLLKAYRLTLNFPQFVTIDDLIERLDSRLDNSAQDSYYKGYALMSFRLSGFEALCKKNGIEPEGNASYQKFKEAVSANAQVFDDSFKDETEAEIE